MHHCTRGKHHLLLLKVTVILLVLYLLLSVLLLLIEVLLLFHGYITLCPCPDILSYDCHPPYKGGPL